MQKKEKDSFRWLIAGEKKWPKRGWLRYVCCMDMLDWPSNTASYHNNGRTFKMYSIQGLKTARLQQECRNALLKGNPGELQK